VLVFGFVVALIVEFGLPIGLALWLRRRFGISWRYFFYGALIFAAFQLLTRVPLVAILSSALAPASRGETFVWAWIAGLSLTAGLFEEIGRYVGYRWLFKPGERTVENGLMYGVGHAGIESIVLVGLPVLATLINVLALSRVDLAQLNLPPEQVKQIQQLLAMPWWMPLLGAFERIATLCVHVSLSLLVLRVFQTGRLVYLWLAVGYHALVNFITVGIALRYLGAVGSEAVIAVFGALSLAYIIRTWRARGETPAV
jgi:uncharacterized membrane protein YhfC